MVLGGEHFLMNEVRLYAMIQQFITEVGIWGLRKNPSNRIQGLGRYMCWGATQPVRERERKSEGERERENAREIERARAREREREQESERETERKKGGQGAAYALIQQLLKRLFRSSQR